mmetsp:Transcript_13668/g.21406  ORF Transcript_13668/g.21406 Transcript_13668/m.21406 type:complete len:287 (+) Transcript_13668:989-1849(+)
MTRVIRLIRLIRIVKLYKSANQAMVREEEKTIKAVDSTSNYAQIAEDLKAQQQKNMDSINIQQLMEDKQESVVGKKLLEKTTHRVIILVLAMLFSVPVFSVSTYLDEPSSFDYGISLIQEFLPWTKAGQIAFRDTKRLQQELNTPLIKLYAADKIPLSLTSLKDNVTDEWVANPDFDPLGLFHLPYLNNSEEANLFLINQTDISIQWADPDVTISRLRDSEKEITVLDLPDEQIYMAVYDLRGSVRLQAVLGILTTILVCAVLGSGAMFFSKLTTDLVISPIEDMI